MTSLWLDTAGAHDATSDPWLEGAAYDVVVVGAGITGLTTALLLAQAGRSVAVLEARQVGAVTTGNTTGKVSLLQGTSLSSVHKEAGPEAARQYVTANRAGQQWLLDRFGEGDLLQRRDAFTYAVTRRGQRKVAAELAACQEAGLPVEAVDGAATGLPEPVRAAVRLADQAQIHSVRVLRSMLADLRTLGAVVVEGVRVTGLHAGDPCTVPTSRGDVTARRVVFATGAPLLDRSLHFARVEPLRSYALAYRVPGDLPTGMYLSADSPSRSLRTAPVDGEELLVVGGNGHGVGRHSSPRKLVADLERWTTEHFPGAQQTHSWSAQDYSSVDEMPFVGPVAGTRERAFLATGYNKWGMTNGVAAALALAGRITGAPPEWAPALAGRGLGARRAAEAVKLNAVVGGYLSSRWALAGLRSLPDEAPAEGEGVVGRDGAWPVAASTVGGTARRVSAVCTHLGGVLRWNDAECSWDCPLHGSRFAPDGSVLEGPATKDLSQA